MSVMHTLEEAHKVLYGKYNRVPERFALTYDESDEDCPKCKGEGSVYSNFGHGPFRCTRCRTTGKVLLTHTTKAGNEVPNATREYLGVYERKLRNNTYLYEEDTGCIALRLHSTVIARWYPWYVELQVEQWSTALTKEVLNEFTPANLYSHKLWYHQEPVRPGTRKLKSLYFYGQGLWGEFGEGKAQADYTWGDRDHIMFFDGMKLSPSGHCLNPPLMRQQRKIENSVYRPGPAFRDWCRELFKRSRKGQLEFCDHCNATADEWLANGGQLLWHHTSGHTWEHYMKDDFVLVPELMAYLQTQEKPRAQEFARTLWEEIGDGSSQVLAEGATQLIRPGFGG